MQKILSALRKLTSTANGVNTAVAKDNKLSVKGVLEDAESAAVSILARSADREMVEYFITARHELAKLIKEADPHTLRGIIGSKVFESISSPIHKDLPIDPEPFLHDPQLTHLQKLSLSMLYYQPYEAENNLILNEEVQKELLSIPSALAVYLKYIFASVYNYAYIGENNKHIEFYTQALKSIVNLVGKCNSDERLILADCFLKTYQGCIPICNDHSLLEPMLLLGQLSEVLLPREEAIDQVLRRSDSSSDSIKVGHLVDSFASAGKHLLAPMAKLDKEKFEISIFALNERGLGEFKNEYPHFKCQTLNSENISRAIKQIRTAEIDILINGIPLTGIGLLFKLRLLMEKVAPIQCIWCANIFTSAIKTMDYWLLGEAYRDAHLQEQAIEKLVHLRDVGYFMPLAASAYEKIPRSEARKQVGLSEGKIVYLSTAHIIKLNPELLQTWLRIIKSTDDSLLVLAPYSIPSMMKKMRRRLEKSIDMLCEELGITRERIIINESNGRASMKVLIDACDVYLDSFPYSGPTSTTEPLVSGRAVVTLQGNTVRGDAASGILRSIGLVDLIACNKDDYINKAIRLGIDKEFGKEVEARIVSAMNEASYLDAEKVSKNLQECLINLANR